MVAEIHNPPAVTAIVKLLPNRVLQGFVLDLTTLDEEGKPWDFDIPSQRRKAEQLIRDLKPRLLVGSPVCSAFCAEQNVSDRKRTEGGKAKDPNQSSSTPSVHDEFVQRCRPREGDTSSTSTRHT